MYYINDSNDFVTFYTITANLYKLHGPGGFTNRSGDTIGPTYKHENPYSKIHGANMGPSGADRTQVDPMLAPWTLLSGNVTRGPGSRLNI